jgi:hypothetical protein
MKNEKFFIIVYFGLAMAHSIFNSTKLSYLEKGNVT